MELAWFLSLLLLVTFTSKWFIRSTDESLGSKERRNGKNGLVSDLSMLVEFNNNSALSSVCDVKSPQAIQNSKRTENQRPDLIKLFNIMKDELDRMVGQCRQQSCLWPSGNYTCFVILHHTQSFIYFVKRISLPALRSGS